MPQAPGPANPGPGPTVAALSGAGTVTGSLRLGSGSLPTVAAAPSESRVSGRLPVRPPPEAAAAARATDRAAGATAGCGRWLSG